MCTTLPPTTSHTGRVSSLKRWDPLLGFSNICQLNASSFFPFPSFLRSVTAIRIGQTMEQLLVIVNSSELCRFISTDSQQHTLDPVTVTLPLSGLNALSTTSKMKLSTNWFENWRKTLVWELKHLQEPRRSPVGPIQTLGLLSDKQIRISKTVNLIQRCVFCCYDLLRAGQILNSLILFIAWLPVINRD